MPLCWFCHGVAQNNVLALNIVCPIFNKSIFHLVTEVFDRKSITDLSRSSVLLIIEIVLFGQILKIDKSMNLNVKFDICAIDFRTCFISNNY